MLKDKVVVVAGGAGLLGQTFVQAILHSGGVPVIADFDQGAGLKARKKISARAGRRKPAFVSLDITSRESIQELIRQIQASHGKIDAFVNAAYPRNANYGRPFLEVDFHDFCQNVNLHLGGFFLCMQQFGAYFLSQGYGNIVNISSVYGIIPPRFEIYENTTMTMPVEYAAIKSAINHLTRYAAKYFKGKNIRVNAISPGGILDRQPDAFVQKYKGLGLNKGRLDRHDIVGALIFLLSDASMAINGQNFVVDDGFSL